MIIETGWLPSILVLKNIGKESKLIYIDFLKNVDITLSEYKYQQYIMKYTVQMENPSFGLN